MSKVLRSWLALTAVPRLGVRKVHSLISQYPPEQLLTLSHDHLSVLGLKPQQIQALLSPNDEVIDRCLAWADFPNRHLIPLTDPHYPYLLQQTSSPPLLLFVEGDLSVLMKPQIAMVGSRQASEEGMRSAYDFAYQLAQHGAVITSGLALGIDGRAHRGALDAKGETVAVLGSGLGNVYPKSHKHLASEVIEKGALVSEFWPWTPPKPEFFPKRNRIISGLSTGVLVIEAALKSGSLITARLALEQGRDVFALPNSIYHPYAQGSNGLIKQGAFLVESIEDIIQQITVLSDCVLAQHSDLIQAQVSSQELPFSHLLANVGKEARSVDVLAEICKQPVQEIMMQLLELELQGFVSAVPGGYVRTRRNLP